MAARGCGHHHRCKEEGRCGGNGVTDAVEKRVGVLRCLLEIARDLVKLGRRRRPRDRLGDGGWRRLHGGGPLRSMRCEKMSRGLAMSPGRCMREESSSSSPRKEKSTARTGAGDEEDGVDLAAGGSSASRAKASEPW
uniref:Uncharacterized protein n=1 Tax=Oryza meridionalis TaxID=40149 RepID=A0A0E0CQA3_9ORYZ